MSDFKFEKLKDLRKSKGYTQLQVANFIGIARTTYADYEKGRILPPVDKITRLCEVFGVQMPELMRVENDTGINIEHFRPKRIMSDEEKIILIRKMQKREKNNNALNSAIGIIENAELMADEKELILNAIRFIKKIYEPTPQDDDFKKRVYLASARENRLKNND